MLATVIGTVLTIASAAFMVRLRLRLREIREDPLFVSALNRSPQDRQYNATEAEQEAWETFCQFDNYALLISVVTLILFVVTFFMSALAI